MAMQVVRPWHCLSALQFYETRALTLLCPASHSTEYQHCSHKAEYILQCVPSACQHVHQHCKYFIPVRSPCHSSICHLLNSTGVKEIMILSISNAVCHSSAASSSQSQCCLMVLQCIQHCCSLSVLHVCQNRAFTLHGEPVMVLLSNTAVYIS